MRGLEVCFSGRPPVLRGLDLTIPSGACVGILGPSGCGKSTLAAALLGLLPPPPLATLRGEIRWAGHDLGGMAGRAAQRLRARHMAWIPQDPLEALNPLLRIGVQLRDVCLAQRRYGRAEATEAVSAWLRRVGFTDTHALQRAYPHELSGGMRQRVLIAMALVARPRLLIADEPTTALDALVRAHVASLLRDERAESGGSLLWISHDRSLLQRHCDRCFRFESGVLVPADEPRPARRRPIAPPTPTGVLPERPGIRVSGVHKSFRLPRQGLRRVGRVEALAGVSLSLQPGEAMGVVGETGSGKSTLARTLVRLCEADQGHFEMLGQDLWERSAEGIQALRRQVQMVFQDPASSLSPWLDVSHILREALQRCDDASLDASDEAVLRLLAAVELGPELATRYRHQLSGGQQQRVAIARALATQPRLLICDEPLASLDAETQERLLASLRRWREEAALSLIFISHDLAQVAELCERVTVLFRGRVVEQGETSTVLQHPSHPYTAALVEVAGGGRPPPGAARVDAPDLAQGCAWAGRCEAATARCRMEKPPLVQSGDRLVACHHPRDPNAGA